MQTFRRHGTHYKPRANQTRQQQDYRRRLFMVIFLTYLLL